MRYPRRCPSGPHAKVPAAHTAPCAAARAWKPTPRQWLSACRGVSPSTDELQLEQSASPDLDEQPPGSRGSRDSTPPNDDDLEFEVPQHIKERNKEFAQRLKGQLILAPLTKGGNLPFRQLCMAYGAEVTMSEMAFAKPLLKGDRVERARLQRAANEDLYGFQVATKVISEGVEAARLAKEAGAAWLDINAGCPVYEASRRGVGAVLLRKPRALAKLVHGVVLGSELPVTVKIRTGEKEGRLNVARVVALLERAGAAAVTIHGRTMEQRYRKPADWSALTSVAAAHPGLPIIGNGDVLTHFDAARRLADHGMHAVMAGRGALIRPWLFQEVKLGRELELDAGARVGVYRQLVGFMKAHFGDDALGRRKAWYFLPWHFAFFHRYRRFPEPEYGEASRAYPLILTRTDIVDPRLGESLEQLDPLERLLRCESESAHAQIAAALWDSTSDTEAVTALRQLASEQLVGWEAEARAAGPQEPGRGGGLGSGRQGSQGRARSDEEY